MRYGIYGEGCHNLAAYETGFTKPYLRWFYRGEGDSPTLFDTQAEAAKAINEASGTGPVRIVGVEETPGEPQREIVEIEGAVDLTDCKFAIVGHVSGHFYGDPHGSDSLAAAPLFDRLDQAAQSSWIGFGRIVAVRETTSEPQLRLYNLVPGDQIR